MFKKHLRHFKTWFYDYSQKFGWKRKKKKIKKESGIDENYVSLIHFKIQLQ